MIGYQGAQVVLLTPAVLLMRRASLGEVFTVFSHTLQAGFVFISTNSKVRMTCGWLICTSRLPHLLYGHTSRGAERLPVLVRAKGGAGRVAEAVFL